MNATRKILFVHDYPPCEGGGLEISTFNLAKELVRLGERVTIATGRARSETYDGQLLSERDGVRIVVLKNMGQLQRLIDGADAVCPQMTFSLRKLGFAAIELGVRLGKKTIVTQHTAPEHIPFSALQNLSEQKRQKLLNRYRELLNNLQITLISPSRALADGMSGFGVNRDILILPYGVAIPTRSADRVKKYDLTFVGEVSYLKGVNYLLDAVNILRRNNILVKVGIVGGGSELKLVQALTESLKLSEQVSFLGYISNTEIGNVYATTKIFVLPSLTEVLPLTLIEAQMAGVPVIASRVGAVGDLLAMSGGGLTFEPGDAGSLASMIATVLQNPQLQKSMAKHGLRYCTTNYSVASSAASFRALV